MLICEEGPCAPEAALYLVEDQCCMMLVGNVARSLQEFARALTHSAFPLDRFKHDRARVLVYRRFDSRNIVQSDELHAAQHWLEAGTVFILAGHGERTEGPSMKRAGKRDDFALSIPTGVVAGCARKFKRPLHRLGAAVRKERAVESRELAQLLRQESLVLVAIKVRKMNRLRCLLANHLHDARVRVSKRVDAKSAHQIQVLLALRVVDMDSPTSLDQ